jgi:hypothetical protein
MDYASNKKLKPKHDKMRRKFRAQEDALNHAINRSTIEGYVEYGINILPAKP